MTTLVNKVIDQLKTLPYAMQWRVFEFIRALAVSVPRGVPGSQLLRFSGTISVDDLQLIREAIQEGCEQVDTHEWYIPS